MKFHVTRAYLDMARAVIDTPLVGDRENVDIQDALLGISGCTCVFSHMALTAFCSSHLHDMWIANPSPLRAKYADVETFEALMAGPLRELKRALRELCDQLAIPRLDTAKPDAWRRLNELLEAYRDYFVHPNPEAFHEHVEAVFGHPWGFSSQVAVEIISHYFEATGNAVPAWLNAPSLRCLGFEVPARQGNGEGAAR
jgi:hypothetical protein